MNDSLNERFKKFLTQLPRSESIDEIRLPKDAQEEKRADFLVENRRVIIELKSLECDPKYKVQEEIDKHKNRAEFPLFYGDMEVHKIFKHLPDGKQIIRKLAEKVSRSIEQGFRSADKQIASTKSIFRCPDSFGLLVLLNENLSILSPELISKKVSQLLTRKDHDGSLRYKHVTSVLILLENYTLRQQQSHSFFPLIVVEGPTVDDNDEFSTILDNIQRAWATYNHLPLLRSDLAKISDSDFVSVEDIKKQQERFQPRHEIWRQQYRNNPYLRVLADDAVLSHGAKLISIMPPSFLKGGKKLPNHVIAILMEAWTHFLEEVRFRGLDLKKMPK